VNTCRARHGRRTGLGGLLRSDEPGERCSANGPSGLGRQFDILLVETLARDSRVISWVAAPRRWEQTRVTSQYGRGTALRAARRHSSESFKRYSKMTQSAVPSTRARSSMALTAPRKSQQECEGALPAMPKHGKGKITAVAGLVGDRAVRVNHQYNGNGARLPQGPFVGPGPRGPSIRPAPAAPRYRKAAMSITFLAASTSEASTSEASTSGTPATAARRGSTLDEDASGVRYVAHPRGARFPRRTTGGQHAAVVAADVPGPARAYPIGARFPRRTQAQLAQRAHPMWTLPTPSGTPTGARFPRRRRGDG